MSPDPKDEKKKTKEKDIGLADEQGGGGEGIFTREDFIRALKKISRPLKPEKPTGEEKSGTSE